MEVIPPKVAVGVAEAVDEAGVVALEVLHEAGDGTFALGFEHEVDVGVHEAKGVDADFVAAGEGIEAVQVEDEVGFGVEDALALGAALIDVVDLSAFEVTDAGRKLGSAFRGHLLISGNPEGKFSFIFCFFWAAICARNVTWP